MPDRPLLLVVATGMRHYREYLLQSIATRYRVHLFLGAEPTWEHPYIEGATVLPDTLDAEALTKAAQELDLRPDGVLCWDEARILQTAHVAAALALPGGDHEAVLRCRDKSLTRAALDAAGVPQPRSVLVGNAEQALEAAAEIGYPVVLKPRALAASFGVVLAHSPDDVRAHFDFTRDYTVPGAPDYDVNVLVEEYADGPEISIDAAVFHGNVSPYCVAHKRIGYPPYFEEVGHLVDGADPLLDDEQVRGALDAAHAALGLTDLMTHTEFRLTPTGPKLIEVNARIGGDMIPYLGLHTNGVDPGLGAADIACGREPDTTRTMHRFGAVGFSYVDVPMRIESITFEDPLPEAVDAAVPLLEPGEDAEPPPTGTLMGRTAYVTAFAASGEVAEAAVRGAQAQLRVVGEQLAPAAAPTSEPPATG